MFGNPFNKPSSKEKQENNLLSFEKAKELIKNGNSGYLAENFEKLSRLSLDQQFEIAKIIAQRGIWELARNFEKLSHLPLKQQFEIAKLIVLNRKSRELARNFEKLFHLSSKQQFELAKIIIKDYYGAEELAYNFEKLSQLSLDQQFEIMELINRLESPVNTLEKLNNLPEEEKIEILQEIASAEYGFLLIYFFEQLDLSPEQQFEIAKLIAQDEKSIKLAENFEKLSYLSPDEQFVIAKLIAQDYFGVKGLTDNFEKLSQLKAISSENKKELYTIFQNADIDKMKLLELVTVIDYKTCPLFVFAKSFGKIINERLFNQLEQALDKGCFK